jgi:hypothetical protein
MGQLVTDVPSVLSLTPPHEAKNKKGTRTTKANSRKASSKSVAIHDFSVGVYFDMGRGCSTNGGEEESI